MPRRTRRDSNSSDAWERVIYGGNTVDPWDSIFRRSETISESIDLGISMRTPCNPGSIVLVEGSLNYTVSGSMMCHLCNLKDTRSCEEVSCYGRYPCGKFSYFYYKKLIRREEVL